MRAAAARQPEVKLFNPRFEEDFAAGKEYDPDRCAPHACVHSKAAFALHQMCQEQNCCAQACTMWLPSLAAPPESCVGIVSNR